MTQTEMIMLVVVVAAAAIAGLWLYQRSQSDSERASRRIPGGYVAPTPHATAEALMQHRTPCPPPTEPECATGKLVGPKYEQFTIRVRTNGACGCGGDEVGARLQRMADMIADANEARADEQFREDLIAMLGGKPTSSKAKTP